MREHYYSEQVTQRWFEICKCASKPMLSMADLNNRTMSNLMKQFEAEDFLNPDNFKIENLYSTHMKLTNELNANAVNYLNEVIKILSASTNEIGDHFNEVVNDLLRQTRANVDAESRSKSSYK